MRLTMLEDESPPPAWRVVFLLVLSSTLFISIWPPYGCENIFFADSAVALGIYKAIDLPPGELLPSTVSTLLPIIGDLRTWKLDRWVLAELKPSMIFSWFSSLTSRQSEVSCRPTNKLESSLGLGCCDYC